jgi:hypothetical protein
MTASRVSIAKQLVPQKKPKASKKTLAKPSAKAKEIQFVDTGETLEEPGSDKINDNISLTPRRRKPFKPVVMQCVLCSREDTVAPLFKRDKETYKCNSCLSKGKVNGPE